MPTFSVFEELRRELDSSVDLRGRRDAAAAEELGPTWTVNDGLLLHAGRIFVPASSPLL